MAQEEAYTELHSGAEMDALMKEGAGPIVIDFWAPWCGPCKAMSPHFAAVARKYADTPVRFFKVNTEEHPELGRAFQVSSIPTVLFILDGKFVGEQIGAAHAGVLDSKASSLLSKAKGEGVLARWFGIGRKP